MTLVAGVDSSTQSCKVLICDAESGAVVRHASVLHPDGTEVHPDHWWQALQQALAAAGGTADVSAISIGGQQHGLVALDHQGSVIRPALLWNDTRSAQAADDLVSELGGAQEWISATGSAPVASLTVTKLRWLADHEPHHAARLSAIALPHDWLTWKLLGGPDAGLDILATDRSEASGTGYFDPVLNGYRRDLLARALRRTNADDLVLPRVLAADARAGLTADGLIVGPGCGDNAGAALALGMAPGHVSVSLGTSGVVAAVSSQPVHDLSGVINGFADASGNYLPLGVTLNGTQTLDVIRNLLDVDFQGFDELVLQAAPGSGGLTMVPYYQGERTPNLPMATASLLGMTLQGLTRPNLARAAVEGLLSLLADALGTFEQLGIPLERLLLIGGGARSEAVRTLAPTIFGREVMVPEPGEYVAKGAAAQAAWTLTGERPWWSKQSEVQHYSGPCAQGTVTSYRSRRHLHVERDPVARGT